MGAQQLYSTMSKVCILSSPKLAGDKMQTFDVVQYIHTSSMAEYVILVAPRTPTTQRAGDIEAHIVIREFPSYIIRINLLKAIE